MIEHIQYFQKGTVYRIRNRKTQKDLCLCSKLELKTRVPQETPDQLWVLNEIKNHEYEVLQVKSGTVLTQNEKKRMFDTKIAKRKMTGNQLWNIVFAQNINGVNYFWIKPTEYEQLNLCASALDDNVRTSSIDQTLNICLWEFVPYRTTNQLLSRLSILKSASSNLILEVPQYASEQGTNIIQYLYTGGGNQRWLIQPYEQKEDNERQYTIRNYSSGLNLTAVFTKGSFKVIQAVFSCSPDQRWFLVPVKDNTYLVQSVSNRQYCLGITNDRGGSPVNLIQDRLKSQWTIQGHIPPP